MSEMTTANASATRNFFVDMIVKDIDVHDAILDLVDNSVDAAYASSESDELNEFRVELLVDDQHFLIEDNCGGIDVDVARNYAFRFGRATEYVPESRIGQFGIGMKRAVFRLGNHFRVESFTQSDHFVIKVNAAVWREASGPWEFPMELEENKTSTRGTTVEVRELHNNVRSMFENSQFERELLGDIADRYSNAIQDGLAITVNRQPADMRILKVLDGHGIVPEQKTYTLVSDAHEVLMKIVAGIGPERRPATESGWYIYCNGRLVVRADRTSLTGWGTDEPGGRGIPAWHDQYRRFRGYVFFESDATSALPWTTTKSEIDRSSEIYQRALVEMRKLIRRYADFTNELSHERRSVEDVSDETTALPAHIATALDMARSRTLEDLRRQAQETNFAVPERATAPIPITPPGPSTTSIQFSVYQSEVDELKTALRLRSARQVGEFAFRRLYEEEIG